ncbi:MAG: APC family permease, partial [Clostridia bacterium]|nr:APC family permease [Clostridia bacterium]
MKGMESIMSGNPDKKKLKPYLSPLAAWALAFGCAVGWGAFVMPGTTFLPIAGPIGTLIGIIVGAAIMLIIGANYHFLINDYPVSGGTYAYTKLIFGYDHGFLNGWFLILTYIAIIWANATALPLIARNLFGSMFRFGLLYEIAGFQIYLGEVLLAISALIVGAIVCLRNRIAATIQTINAFVLFLGITICFAVVMSNRAGTPGLLLPAFSPDKNPGTGIFTIIALAPWAFVGFESIAHSAEEFRFSYKKTFPIMAVAVGTAGAAYAMLAVLAASVLPDNAQTWADYISNLDSYSGVAGLPTFFAAKSVMGRVGSILLGFTTLAAIMTGLIGHYIASSRLLYVLSEDNILPAWFGKLNKNKVPRNAILFLLLVSSIIPLFGRTAVSWIVDVTTVGATIAYAYVSASALKAARQKGKRIFVVTGAAGLAVSCLFILYFLIPHLIDVTALSTESYLILAAWGILGFFFFLYAFRKDEKRRLGRSTITWIVLLALIIFTSTVWMRQAVEQATEASITPIHSFYIDALKKNNINIDHLDIESFDLYMEEQLVEISSSLNNKSLIQTMLIVISLAV